MEQERFNQLSAIILDASIAVHKEMGPGLLESVYQQCLVREFFVRNVRVDTNVIIPLIYKGYVLSKDYMIDMLIEEEIIIELKACEGISPVHEAQIISYLKLAKKNLGSLLTLMFHY